MKRRGGTGNRVPDQPREQRGWPPVDATRPAWKLALGGGMDFPGGFGYLVRLRSGYFQLIGIRMVKLTVRERESIQEAVRRFRKLVERSGIKKEMRRREFFEKPSETRRRARLRAERRTKRNRLLGV